jgi:hypothetical protein
MLELIQKKYFFIIMGEGVNNFIIEYNKDREEDLPSAPMSVDPILN